MKLYLTGGFLGSGKTTAIHSACKELISGGIRVAVITNDQGNQLVDSEFLKGSHIPTQEVPNGCFCCRYDQLVENISVLTETINPEIIFAESVGSCTDLIATIANPLFSYDPQIEVVISVFADASLLLSLINGNACFLNESVQYIYKKQLDEADVLVINKTDELNEDEWQQVRRIILHDYPQKQILFQNSLDLDSIRHWIQTLENIAQPVGRKVLEIDYDVYAEGEANLAWLDEKIVIHTLNANAAEAGNRFTSIINSLIRKYQYPVGHLKFIMDDGLHKEKISFTTIRKEATKHDINTHVHLNKITVLINARVQTSPARLKKVISDAADVLENEYECKVEIQQSAVFKPGYPQPVHRLIK